MVNMTKKQSTQKKVEVQEVQEVQDTAPETQTPVAQPASLSQDPLYIKLLERIEKVEKENEELKWNKVVDPKSKYNWPRKYSYKMWNWIAICDYVSKKEEETRDYAYVNQFGQLVDNHILELKLANGKKVKTPVWEFNKWYTKSEYVFPKEDKISEWYVIFEWENGKEFKVMAKIIN